MPTEMINEILNGNNAVIAGALLMLWRFHNQSGVKLDRIADNIVTMNNSVEKHTIELQFGAKEMARIDEHNKTQDIQISENRDDIQKIKGKLAK